MEAIPGHLKPQPFRLGDQPAERLLDLDLYQVYLVRYRATPPFERVKAHLERAGVSALVLFTEDGETFHLLHVERNRPTGGQADGVQVRRLLDRLWEAYEKGEDPLALREWVRETLEALTRGPRRPYRNQGLFSEHYLEHRLRESPEWGEDPEPVRKALLELYRSKEALLQGANEAQTEEEFIRPVLERLRFAYWVQDTTRATGGAQRPDYILYPDEATRQRAAPDEEEARRYAPALAILEAKHFGRDLDVKTRDPRDRVHSPVSPAFQLSQYLLATGVEWGILTNGREWRLYWGRGTERQKRYFAVDLVQALEDPEAFRFFWLFFRKEAFLPGAQGSFLRRVLEGSERYGLRVSQRLKEVVFERVFPLLAEGFIRAYEEKEGRPPDGDGLREIYRATLVLLYRLLFLLYAEDRDLLPVWDTLGYGYHSLARLRQEVAQGMDQGRIYSERTYELWQRLTDLFRLLDRGDPALRVPPYNGGLFKEGRHPFLEAYRVADAFLAPALDQLARQADEDGRLRFVDYKYLTVRELGAVYEGLLEFRLEVAKEDLAVVREKDREVYKPKALLSPKEKAIAEVPKGKPYLVRDEKERRASGSYYTPDYVVAYIVRKTLEPLVQGRKEALRGVLEEYRHWSKAQDRHPTREGAERLAALRRKALDTLLDLKVVDPAMGSGHFLVRAVDYLSERFADLITELRAEPVIDALAELREEIKKQMADYRLEVKDEQLSDLNLLKRMVMKRCIFGVDLNDMAVELAKLSLWLDAFTVGAPLSFLDHHLRQGNSVLGVSKGEFLDWAKRENWVWLSEMERQLEEATLKAQALLEVRDLTLEEVALSQRLYEEVEKALGPIRRALDVYAAGLFLPKPKRGEPQPPLREALVYLPTLKLSDLANPGSLAKESLSQALEFARKRHLFHWELEFPEVFFSPERRHNPGFDAVIGNPPYVRQEGLGEENKLFLQSVYGEVYAGKADLYTYFFARGLSVLREGGRLGFISSRQFTRAAYGEGLRRLLAGQGLLEVVDFGENPVFEEAATFPAIFILRKGPPSYPVRFKAIGREEFHSLMEAPAETRDEELARLVEGGEDLGPDAFRPEGWTLARGDLSTILRKMEANGMPLGDYVGGEIYWGIKTGLNKAFFIDEPTRSRLIYEDPKSAELIKPLLVGDDVRHYYARWPNDPKTQYLIFTRRGVNIDEYPAIKGHLEGFRERLEPKPRDWDEGKKGPWPGRKPGEYAWYEIQDAVAYYDLFERPKIVYPDISKEPRFFLDRQGFYLDATLFFIPKEDWFLLAVLNSNFVFKALRAFVATLGDADEGGRLRLKTAYIKRFPIPKVRSSTEKPSSSGGHAPINIKALYEGQPKEVLAWAEAELAMGRKDTVADLLAFLAQEMQRLQAERLSREREWQDWVEHHFKGAGKLGKEWLREGWVQEGLREGYEAIRERFRARGVGAEPRVLAQLERYTQETLEALRPLYGRLKVTDELIDRLVARLYGLTEEEAERLWAAPSP